MNGCLKGALRLAFLGLLAIVALVAWWYREPILRTASRWLGPRSQALPPVADTAVGAPTPAAVGSSQAKLRELARRPARTGRDEYPDSVVLTPNEVASLIGSGMDWAVRKTFDSLRVELLEGALAIHARLDTRALSLEALGPLAGMLHPREPLRIAGPLRIERPGTARWTIEELSIRGFPFPAPAVKQLAQQMAGADAEGAVAVRVEPAITSLAIHPTRMILYRDRGADGGRSRRP